MPGSRALVALLAALALLALALVIAGPWRLPPSRMPPSLLRELEQRRRDLSALSAAAAQACAPTAAPLDCAALSGAAGVALVGSGITKLVLSAALPPGGEAIALKSVHWAGRDMSRCVQRYGHPEGCHRLATYKLLKETVLLQSLHHPGIIQARSTGFGQGGARQAAVQAPAPTCRAETWLAEGRPLRGQCFNRSLDPEMRVITILELGTPLEMIQLLQTPWEERFKICLDLVQLLHYLAHSPLGSVALLDFQPRQFVLVDGILKVTDMDDASTEELSCQLEEDCQLEFPTKSFSLRCTAQGKCEGINEKRNLFNAYRYFFTYLLPHTAPLALQPILKDILNATGELRYGINETLKSFQKVLHLYKSGLYLQKKPSHLKEYIALNGLHSVDSEDYKCWLSYSNSGCVLSVHNAEEAAVICNSHPHCQRFIVTPKKTWTGKRKRLSSDNQLYSRKAKQFSARI
ncbi:hypothetical protein lerEdw1_013067 [Lerista edwardsae]|nr:hypothetical protein lerEdw1_013067 [Lerista edwardsae]